MHRARLLALGLLVAAALAPAALGSAGSSIPHAHTFGGTPTVGALFAAGSAHHFCSASVVRSRRGDVILTAAHCIRGNSAGLVFAPGFHGGVSPLGRWRVNAVYLDPAWVATQDPRRDFAFLLVAARRIHGHLTELQSVTGANRLGGRPRAGVRVTVPAYPAGTDNDPITCRAPVYYDGVYPAFNCTPYPGGTSGAPWLAHGHVVGLIGGLHQGGCFPSTSYSPPFGADVARVYARAARHALPDVAPVPGPDGC